MLDIQGKENTARIFTDNVDSSAMGQVIHMLNEPIVKDMQVRIMPDINYSKGAVVGTSLLSLNKKIDRIAPSIVSADLGCGVMIRQIDPKKLNPATKPIKKRELKKLDGLIRELIPSGSAIHSYENKQVAFLNNLTFKPTHSDLSDFAKSLGTLGGGNHFIELGFSKTHYWLSVHTGSRLLGQHVFNHHYNKALETFSKSDAIQKTFAYLEKDKKDNYLQDVMVAQQFAHNNREWILDTICKGMGWKILDELDSVHNYIDLEHQVIRKGSISSQLGERLVIPLNMKEGFVLAMGKGNPEWNFTSPHGSGRKLSRSQAKQQIELSRYEKSMSGVYSTSVGKSTIDESPMVYKNSKEILDLITDTVDIEDMVRARYNFKASKQRDTYDK